MFRTLFVLPLLLVSSFAAAQEQCPLPNAEDFVKDLIVPQSYIDCRMRNARKRVGLYNCFIEHVAGIQYEATQAGWDQSRPPFVGQIKPKKNFFNIEIEEKESPSWNKDLMFWAKNSARECLKITLFLLADGPIIIFHSRMAQVYLN
jgi:hypothetical protein